MSVKLKPRIKKKKPAPPKLATTGRTEPAKVYSPWDTGLDTTQRVIDTIAAMHARKQITDREFQAATWYRTAYEINAGAGVRSTLDNSLMVTMTPGPRSPTERTLNAAEKLNEAARLLGPRDNRVVELIVGMGLSVDQAARKVYPRASRSDREAVGRKLREGLETLADAWLPAGGGRPRNRFKAFSDDARPMSIVIGEFDQAPSPGTAHARTNWRGKVWVERKG